MRPHIAVCVLSGAEPAALEMARVLGQRQDIDVLHVIAHGQPGEVNFSSGVFSLESLDEHSDDLARLGAALAADGEIRLWACEAAAGDKGAAFIGAFARSTGVPVVASAGRIGAAAHGGNWNLDGRASSPVLPPLTSEGIAAYPGVLATFNATTGIDDLEGGNSPDTFVVTDTNQVQAADRFEGGGGADTVEVGTASGVDVDLTAAAADGVKGFLNVEEIAFANTSGVSTVTINADQFGIGKAQNDATVTGAAGVQNFVINLTAPGAFDLTALRFDQWTAGIDTVTVNGSSGPDTITGGDNVSARILGGAGNDTLFHDGTTVAASARYDGGAGTDTLRIVATGNFSGAASDGVDGFINIEAITFVDTAGTIIATFGAAQFGAGKISATSTITGDSRTQGLVVNLAPGETLDLSGLVFLGWTAGADSIVINGSSSGETIVGTSQSDVIVSGGGGIDDLTGGGGLDTFIYTSADALLAVRGTGNNGSVTGYGRITDFAPGATAATSELLGYTARNLGTSSSTNDSTLLLHTGETIKTHTVRSGILTFDDGTGSQSLINLGDVAAATQYVAANDWGKEGASVAFTATISGVTHTYVYTQTTTDSGIENGAMVDLVNVAATALAANGTTLSVLGEAVPNAPSITSIPENDGGGINAAEASGGTPVLVSLSGTNAISDDTLTINWGGQAVSYSLTASDIIAGNATVTVPPATLSAQGQGTFDVTATLTNAAGIASSASPPVSVTFDTVAPTAPSIAAIPENAGGGINASEVSDGTSVVVSLSGTGAAAGDTLTISWGGQTVGYTLVAGDILAGSATVTVPQTALVAQGNGTFNVTARLTDVAGNVGATSAAAPVTVDTLAPTAEVAITAITTDSGASSGDYVTSDTTLTVSGTHDLLNPGEKVQVSSDGGANWADVTSAATTWSYTDPNAHATSFTYQARVVGSVGNVGANTASQAVTIDTATPTAPSIAAIPENAGGGINASEASNGTPVVVGLSGIGAAVGDTLTINWGGQTVGYTLVADDILAGSATVTVPLVTLAAQGNGTFNVTARLTDVAGNVGTNSTATSVTVDTVAPTAEVLITAITSDSGASSNDFITSDTSLTVSGTHGPLGTGERVQVSSNGGASWAEVTSSTATTWSFTDPAAHTTSFTYLARVIGSVGNVGANTASQPVTIDTAAPTAPSITSIPDNAGGGINAGEASDGTTVVVSLAGTGAVAGDTLTISSEGQSVIYTLVAGDVLAGSATVTAPLATLRTLSQGTFSVTARLTDPAGNVGPASEPVLVTIDTSGPAAPVIVSVTDNVSPVTGGVADNGRSNDTTLTVAGTAEPGSTVTLYDTDGTTELGTGVATGGAFSITTSVLGEGTHALTARATDGAGNQGAYATAFQVIVDTTAPGAPSITGFSSDSGTAGDHVTSDQTLTLSGTAEAGSTVEVFRGATSIGTAVAGISGDWSLADATLLADGSYQFTAKATDAAGNQGAASTAFQVTIDSTPPAAPVFASVIDDVAPATGPLADNGFSNDPTLTIDGSAELGTTVRVYDGTTLVGTGQAIGGAGPIITSTLSEGAHILTLRATDAAGNESAASTEFHVTIDTTGPVAPVIVSVTDDVDPVTGAVVDNGSSNDNTLTIAGTAEPGSTVTIYDTDGTTVLGTGVATGGMFSIPTSVLDEGVHTLTVKATDMAGNQSPASAAFQVTIDATAPAAEVLITAIATDGGTSSSDYVTSDTTLTVSGTHGTLGVGEKVQVSSDGGVNWADVTTSTATTWSYTDPTTHATSFTYIARIVDGVGNVGANTSTQAVIIDTVAPTAPSITIPENGGGGINAAEASDGTTVVVGLSGTGAAAGDTLTISWGGQTAGYTLVAGDISGSSATVTVPLSTLVAQGPGTFNVTARLIDVAGNAGPNSAPVSVTGDATAPASEVLITAITTDSGTSSSDYVTSDTTLTVSGTHGPLGSGEKVQVSSDGGASWADVTSSTASTWSYTDPATHAASFTYQARIVDGVGNVGADTSSQLVTIDTAAPTAPSITSIPENAGGGINAAEVSDGTPVVIGLSGTGAVAGDTLTIDWGGQTFNYALVAGDISAGSATVTVPLVTLEAQGNGTFDVTARLTDVAGNVGATSAAAPVTVDTSAPTAEVVITAISTDSGASSGDYVTSDTTLTVSGTHGALNPGEKVQVSSDGGANWADVTTSTATTWSYTDPNAHATSFIYQARVIGAVGNVGANTAIQAVTIDSAAPTAPVITSIPETSGGVVNAGEASNGTPVVVSLSGTGAAAGDTLTINWGGQAVSRTLVAGDISANSATVTVPLATITAQGQGTFNVTARLTDIAGNAGANSTATPVTVDTELPTAPVIASVTDNVAPVTGAVADSGHSNDTTLTIAGTAESGSTVTIYDSDRVTVLGTGVATSGIFSITTSVLSQGDHGLTAKATDAAGNQGPASAVSHVTIDTTAPAAPQINLIAENAGGGIDASEASDGTVVEVGLSGTGAVTGDTLTVNWGGQTVSHTIDASDLFFGYVPVTVPLATITAQGNGTFNVATLLTDLAGNASPISTAASVTVDTVAPAAPSIAIPENAGGGINAAESSDGTTVVVDLSGTGAAAGDTLTVNWGTQTVSYTLVAGDISGNSATVTVPLATLAAQGQGTFDVTTMLTDIAGNAGPNSTAVSVTVDTTADVAPAVTVAVSDPLVSNTEKIAVELTVSGLDADAAADVTFTGTAGASVVVHVTGNGPATANLSGLDDGPVAVSVVATDTSGNTATGTGTNLVLDTTADFDGNLNLSILSDTSINASERREPVVFTTSGIDGDVTSTTVRFTDSVGHSIVVAASAGFVVFDSFVSGQIASTVTVTDAAGNTASAPGAPITLDLVNGTDGPDRLIGTSGNDTYNGLAGDDIVAGGPGDDTLTGGGGNDRLNGGAGTDTMTGGDGNDIYFVDNGADQVVEAALGGVDAVFTGVDYDLADGQEVESLRALRTTVGLSLAGNELANTLVGGAGNDTLDGGDGIDKLDGRAGADTMTGGLGNDIYYVDDDGDRAVEVALGGTDAVVASLDYELAAGLDVELLRGRGTVGLSLAGNELANTVFGDADAGNDTLDGGGGNDWLYGGAGNDTMTAGVGNDAFNGGTGNDSMTGGAGNDTYTVDNGADLVFETGLGGVDLVFTTVDYQLAAGQEVETLRVSGTVGLSLTGNELVNTLIGGNGNDTVDGGDGNDWLYGGAGNDILDGGVGNHRLYGDAGNDTMTGGDGNDALNGGAGNDSMTGGAGNDTYTVDNGADLVFETGLGGVDVVFTTVDYQLAAGQEVEFLRVSGTVGLSLTGNELVNTLVGGTGNDTLDGGDGNDALYGGAGNDRIEGGAGNDLLTGGTGADMFLYSAGDGDDRFSDFSSVEGDKVDLTGLTVSNIANNVAALSDGSVLTAQAGYIWTEGDFI
jgi:Ca2+-binding RTX toxin-like protein